MERERDCFEMSRKLVAFLSKSLNTESKLKLDRKMEKECFEMSRNLVAFLSQSLNTRL